MSMMSLRVAVAIGFIGVISGCASNAEFQQFKKATNERLDGMEVVQRRHDQVIAFHTRELERVVAMHQRQIDLVARLQQTLADVNAGMRGAVEQANRQWSALQALQDDLSRMNALQKRFKPVRHGESWLLVYDDA